MMITEGGFDASSWECERCQREKQETIRNCRNQRGYELVITMDETQTKEQAEAETAIVAKQELVQTLMIPGKAVVPFRLYECPMSFLKPESCEVVPIIYDAIEGRWPCEGGRLDQSHLFLEMLQLFTAEKSLWRKDLGGGN